MSSFIGHVATTAYVHRKDLRQVAHLSGILLVLWGIGGLVVWFVSHTKRAPRLPDEPPRVREYNRTSLPAVGMMALIVYAGPYLLMGAGAILFTLLAFIMPPLIVVAIFFGIMALILKKARQGGGK